MDVTVWNQTVILSGVLGLKHHCYDSYLHYACLYSLCCPDLLTYMSNLKYWEWVTQPPSQMYCFNCQLWSEKWSLFVCPIGGTLHPPCSLMSLSVALCALETNQVWPVFWRFFSPQSLLTHFYVFFHFSASHFNKSSCRRTVVLLLTD